MSELLKVGATFDSIEEIREAVNKYCILNDCSFARRSSDTKRLHLYCPSKKETNQGPQCPVILTATQQRDGTVRIHQAILEHLDVCKYQTGKATVSSSAKFLAEDVGDFSIVKPIDIRRRMARYVEFKSIQIFILLSCVLILLGIDTYASD